jgi:hypothetical protein
MQDILWPVFWLSTYSIDSKRVRAYAKFIDSTPFYVKNSVTWSIINRRRSAAYKHSDRHKLQTICISYKIHIGTKKKWDRNKAGLLPHYLMAQWKRDIVSSVVREPCRLVVFTQWQNTVTKHDSLTAGITTKHTPLFVTSKFSCIQNNEP